MLLSFLFSLFYFFLLAQAGRKPKKGRQTTSTVSTADPSLSRSSSLPAVEVSSISATGVSSLRAAEVSSLSAAGVSSLSAAGVSSLSAAGVSSLPTTGVSSLPPSTTSAAGARFSDSPIDLFEHADLKGSIICQGKERFKVLHQPDCMLSVEQIHAPRLRGPGLATPPTADSSNFRFYGHSGNCELYVTATYIVSVGRSGVPTLWQPTEIEWIQIWIHVRLRAELIINSCVGEPGASAELLRNKHGGRGGASSLLLDGVRLSNRMLQNDRTGPDDVQPPGIQFLILVHDGVDLAIARDEAIARGELRLDSL